MLLYEYPPKLDIHGKQKKAIHDLNEHHKMRRNMFKNLILAGIIFVIGFFVNVIIIKVLLWIIALGNALTGLLLYNVSALSRDTSLYTRIMMTDSNTVKAMLYQKSTLTSYYIILILQNHIRITMGI